MQLYNKYATQDAGFCLPVYIRFQKPPIGASPRFVSQQATGSRLAVFVDCDAAFEQAGWWREEYPRQRNHANKE